MSPKLKYILRAWGIIVGILAAITLTVLLMMLLPFWVSSVIFGIAFVGIITAYIAEFYEIDHGG